MAAFAGMPMIKRIAAVLVLVVANLKGGSDKTTGGAGIDHSGASPGRSLRVASRLLGREGQRLLSIVKNGCLKTAA